MASLHEIPATRRTVYMKRLAPLVPVLSLLLVVGCSSIEAVPRYLGPQQEAMGATGEPSVPRTYRVNYGDVLGVTFVYHSELDTVPTVRPDGQITVPGLGDFYAVGLTPDELETDIARRASITHRNPVVSVLVKEYTQHRCYVGGNVRRPGFVSVRPGLTSLRAVLERGGFTRGARLDSVLHVAWSPSGEYSAQRINLETVLESGSSAQDIVLGPNDVVYVPSTWIADAGLFVDQYIRDLIPIREPSTRLPNIGE